MSDHCRNGHQRTAANTYVTKTGNLNCRICTTESVARNRERVINARIDRQAFEDRDRVKTYVPPVYRGFISKSAPSLVDHPAHYNTGKIEVIEFLEDQKLDPHSWNAVKYVCRAGRKDPAKTIEDVEKAIWYLKRRLELLTAEREGRDPKRPNDMSEAKK